MPPHLKQVTFDLSTCLPLLTGARPTGVETDSPTRGLRALAAGAEGAAAARDAFARTGATSPRVTPQPPDNHAVLRAKFVIATRDGWGVLVTVARGCVPSRPR